MCKLFNSNCENFKSCIFAHFTIEMAHIFYTTIETSWSSFLHFDRCVYLIIWLFVSLGVSVSFSVGQKSDKMENTLTIAWTLNAHCYQWPIFVLWWSPSLSSSNKRIFNWIFILSKLFSRNLYHFQKNSFCAIFFLYVSIWLMR